VLLGPAMRADVMLGMQGGPVLSYRVVDDFYDRLSYTLVRLSYDPAPPLRRHPSDAPLRLSSNPLPRPDLANAVVQELRMQGGMMGGMGMMGMGADAAWAINGHSMTGDGIPGMPPLFEIARGRSCILDFKNETTWWHPMYLHGHSFKVLSRDGAQVPHDEWGDTVGQRNPWQSVASNRGMRDHAMTAQQEATDVRLLHQRPPLRPCRRPRLLSPALCVGCRDG